MSGESNYVFKVLLLGDSTVGKTCFLMRFTENTFQEIHMSTIGLDYRFKKMPVDDGKEATVQIWDTAGQDRFRAITKNYYKGAHGIILIYDVTNQKTFENVRNWVTQIRENASEKAIIYIVGNKIDDKQNKVVTKEDGEKMAKEFDLKLGPLHLKNIYHVFKRFHNKPSDGETESVKRLLSILGESNLPITTKIEVKDDINKGNIYSEDSLNNKIKRYSFEYLF